MWPKNAAPRGVLAPSRASPESGESGSRLLAGANASMLALVPPSRRLQQKQRDSASSRSLPLPVQPPRHACELLWAGGIYEVRGEPPTQRLLVPLSSGTRSLGAGHRTQAGKAPPVPQSPPPQVARSAPPTLTLHREAIPTPRLHGGAPLNCHNPHPRKQAQELGVHKPLRSLHCHRAALSTRLA